METTSKPCNLNTVSDFNLPVENKVSACIWNINGLKNEKIDRISSKDSVAEEIFAKNDIICLTETWRDKTDRDLTKLDGNFIGFHQLDPVYTVADEYSYGRKLVRLNAFTRYRTKISPLRLPVYTRPIDMFVVKQKHSKQLVAKAGNKDSVPISTTIRATTKEQSEQSS